MNVAKVELGRLLFDDTRLSVNGQQSCAGCHRQEARFLQNLRQDTLYQRLVARGFPSEREPFTMTHLVRAIAAFERMLISLQSSYCIDTEPIRTRFLSLPSVEKFSFSPINVAGAVSYPAANTGIHQVTGRAEDIGKFRVPTLRDIAVTAPYMHDGSTPR